MNVDGSPVGAPGSTTLESPESHPRQSWRDLVFLRILPVLALGSFTAVAVVTSWQATAPLPFWDEWEALTVSEYLAEPFAQHNEHRIALPKLVFALDAALFHGTNRFEVFVSLGLGILIASLVARSSFASLPERARLAVFSFCTCAILSVRAWENFTWGFAVQTLLAHAAGVVAFVCTADPRHRLSTLAGAVVGMCCAAYSMGNGLLVGPIAVVLSVAVGRPRPHHVVLGIATVAIFLGYFHGYETPHESTSPVTSLVGHPVATVKYFLALLGSPIVRTRSIAPLVGACGVVLAATALPSIVRRVPVPEGILTLRAVVLFAAGTSFVAALGRAAATGQVEIASRYATPALLFWSALILERASATTGRLRRASIGLACLMIVGLATAVPSSRAKAFRRSDRLRLAEAAVLAGSSDPESLETAYADPTRVTSRAPTLRRYGLSIFSDPWAHWSGTPLEAHVRKLEDDCIGGVERVDVLESVEGASVEPTFRVFGRLDRNRRVGAYTRVVVTNEDGLVVGYAFDFSGRAVPAGEGTTFSGYLSPSTPRGSKIIAFALADDERVACRLRGTFVVP